MPVSNSLRLVSGLLLALGFQAGASAQSVRYNLDPTHTFVTFEVTHFGTSTNRGRFDRKEGFVELDTQAKKGKVEVSIDMKSINTGTPKFDSHLLSKDFFRADEFATARFTGENFTFDGDKVSAVAGQLTMLGKTQPLTLKARHFNCFDHPMLKKQVCGGDFEATLERSQWGMTGLLPMVPDTVRLVIQVEGVKQ